jgi:hypothetical protein
MLRAFDGRGFHPHRVLQSLFVQLGGKTIFVYVEVVDAPLDYNLFLGRSWFYTMTVVASSVFRCVQFPYQGKIVTIDLVRLLHSRRSHSFHQQYSFLGRYSRSLMKVSGLVF